MTVRSESTVLNRWSTSPWLKPSFRKDLNTKRHLFALINLARTCSLYLLFSWNVTPKMGSSVHCGMLLTWAISWIKPFLRKIVSLHFKGLQIVLFSLDQIKNWSTKSIRQWPLLQMGTMRVEWSAYLNRARWLSMLISRSLIKMLNKYGPLTLPCVVPLFTHCHCAWKLL